ncbi:MAG: HEPN domain-containing protein [Nanoarchaeota archaeon]|nr:HEPN domain-containing protein [Nanoarchaeota archaeon]MBU4124228.1 HEPN domain-containing protein [Nanoarchaeota archaeon]
MKMNSEELLSKGMIEALDIDSNLIKKTLTRGEKNLKSSKKIFKSEEYDWTLAVAYSAMLQAGRALMFSKGYRPKGEFKHLSVIEFVHSEFGDKISSKMIRLFDNYRKKRNKIVYEEYDIVSEDEAEEAIKFADEFLNMVKKILKVA